MCLSHLREKTLFEDAAGGFTFSSWNRETAWMNNNHTPFFTFRKLQYYYHLMQRSQWGKSNNLGYKTPVVLRFFLLLFVCFCFFLYRFLLYPLYLTFRFFQPLKTYFRFSTYLCQQYYQPYNCFAFFKNKKKNIAWFFKQNNWVSKSSFEAWLIIIKISFWNLPGIGVFRGKNIYISFWELFSPIMALRDAELEMKSNDFLSCVMWYWSLKESDWKLACTCNKNSKYGSAESEGRW